MARPRSSFKKEDFFFWRYDPGTGKLPQLDWKLEFEAHITTLSDTSSPSYSENFDMGRADPKVMYTGASRNFNISFFLVGLDKEEHKNNYIILDKLGKMTYPIYQLGNGYNSPHVRFQVGRLMSGYGVITSLTYDWKPESPWVDNRPLYTDISMTIKILANSTGYRPNAGFEYMYKVNQ